jgi:BirA family transcriptional regulator, biotin operon repressor / biotin---[acetyl-CoA-carboxylase] ligase
VTIRLDPTLAARGYALRHVGEIGSTNTAAKEALRDGADRLWIVADRQIAGRGRHERGWVSPAGNLHASLALAAPCPPAQLPLLGFVAGVALIESITGLAPDLAPSLALKWPNDALLDGAKLAGLLLEGESDPQARPGVVIGMGVNIAEAPAGLDQPVASLVGAAPWISRDSLFEALHRRFAEALSIFNEGRGFGAIRQRWLASSLPMGQRLRVKLPDGAREGAFAGLDAQGALRLETDSGPATILAGDVFVLP